MVSLYALVSEECGKVMEVCKGAFAVNVKESL
jgi:hypothetical protein